MRRLAMVCVAWLMAGSGATAADQVISFNPAPDAIRIQLGGVPIATYVFRDPQVGRPYFAHLATPAGHPVTRNHPPRTGQDAVDHPGLHTGIWLSFGDLNGCDYWRLKARTEHVRFVTAPQIKSGIGHFTVLNRYLSTDGKTTECEETCRYTIQPLPTGYLIDMQSEFRPGASDLEFGDQEEMGLGIRVATPLAVDRQLGGRILDSAGRINGAAVWGQTADWCDYSGPFEKQWIGLTVLSSPENFRPSWNHARDYGFLAVNPFGRNAFTKGEKSRVVVKPGETFKLRFGVAVHATPTANEYQPAKVYQDFAKK